MQNEEHQSLESAYDFNFTGGESNTYTFETSLGIIYKILFKPTDYLFPVGSPHNEHTFEFIIDIYDNPTSKSPPLDMRTSVTTAAIFKDFFDRKDKTIALYICDSSDSKQRVRQRKFTLWFDAFNLNRKYVKLDTGIEDKDGILYPISIMLHRTNPYKYEIFQQFESVILGYSK